MAVTRIDRLADEEKARFNEWADKWTDVGLRTGPADRERFEQAVKDCYRFAGIDWPDVVVWVPSPLVLAFAAPAAALAIELIEAEQRHGTKFRDGGAVRGAVRGAVDDAVDEQDDPGNPGQKVGLYDLPAKLNPYPERVRVLLWVNGTIDRDGRRRRGGLTVPADMPDAVTAAAWTYGVAAGQYRELERRT